MTLQSTNTNNRENIEPGSSTEEKTVGDTEFRVYGNVSVMKRQIILDNVYIMYEMLDLYEKNGIGATISHSKEIQMFEKRLNDLGIDLSGKLLLEYGFCKHKSGIFDAKFIIFTLQQMFIENVDGGIASKTMFKLKNMKRFINFLSPNSCKDNGSKIDFNSLSKLNIRTVGVFGSKKEIVNSLKGLGFGTTKMYVICRYVFLMNDSFLFRFAV